jgi:hypothetical protein
MTQPKPTDLASRVEQVEQSAATLGGRADGIEVRLAEVGILLTRMSDQIDGMAPTARDEPGEPAAAYQVHPAPPWWQPGDDRCTDTIARLRDWVTEVYRPVFGYLSAMLADCWDRHPLCLAYLDTLHEAWCLLYIPPRDPKMVFAQLDWLTRPLLQAAEVMARETSGCRNGGHREPGQATAPAVPPWLNGHR